MRAWIALLALAPTALAAADDGVAGQRAFLERKCLYCHSGPEPSGGFDLGPLLSLDDAALTADPAERPGDWRYLAERVRRGEMPPADGPPPLSADERERFVTAVEAALALRYDPSLAPDPVAPVARRLTRVEVDRTLRDLLGIEAEAERFLPSESVALGFDNVGSAQSLAPAAVEDLLDFAAHAAAAAIRWDDPDLDRRTRITGEGLDPAGGGRLNSRGTLGGPHAFPRAGRYRVRATLSADQAGPDLARARLHVGDVLVREVEVAAESSGEPEVFEAEFGVLSGALHPVEVEFVNDYFMPDAPDPGDRDRNLVVHALEIEGPLGPPPVTDFQRALFAEFGPELGDDRARAVVAELCERLWRRPADPREVASLLRLVDEGRPLEERVSVALEALLASPRFHFRIEADPEDGPPVRPLDGWELATRLSYFLWSSAPDAELREAARSGALLEEPALRAQVARMLDDPRAGALAENFAPQWLSLTRLPQALGDEASSALLASMRRESELLFDCVLRERRPALDLLAADFTFVDGALAEHYGLPGVAGPHFRRVSLRNTPRRGLLGHASVLTATSDPGRTSPVLRGVWILDSLLGAPPPPPPPDVPALEASGATAAPADLRAALAQHRADPACASCHASIDPLGFALEGFDRLGRARPDRETLDLGAELPDGRRFEGLGGLVEVLRGDERFVRTLLERLTVYALGRPLGAPDRGWIARTLEGLDPERVVVGELIEAVVLSPAFRQRRRIGSPPD